MALLGNYPKLALVTAKLDKFLCEKHPGFFGDKAQHPFLELKSKKIIHDTIWGTFSFSSSEMAVLDTPLIQRLRNIHQTGLAYQVYPSARHSRLEHSLGVLVVASKVFDALALKHRGSLHDCVKVVFNDRDAYAVSNRIDQMREELRMAALLHDVGHSLHSHASERVYGKLKVLTEAAEELSNFVGKRKGAGEVISFCFALTPCLGEFLQRAHAKTREGGGTTIDMESVALMIVGRSKHPLFQFLGDIISSDIDADKLDYLLRDSGSAGLPLSYDVHMYLNSAQIERDEIADGEGALQRLYKAVGTKNAERKAPDETSKYSHYEGYRLTLPKRAMHVLEQIVICKMMLFSYVYHHPKVRAAEGLLEKMLDLKVDQFKKSGMGDWKILEWFLEASDSSLVMISTDSNDLEIIKERAYRIVNRLLPREIFRLSASESRSPQKRLLADFLTAVRDKEKGRVRIESFEQLLGEELRRNEGFKKLTWKEALAKAGAWLDVSKSPNFEETQKVVSKGKWGQDQGSGMFPVHAWQHAYASYRCYVRVYGYSEYREIVKASAIAAMKQEIGIEDDDYYRGAERTRF